MSKLLEIFGRAIAVNTPALLWHWIDTVTADNPEFERINEILNLVSLGSCDIAEDAIGQYLSEKPDCVIGRMAAAALCLENSNLAGAVENLQSVYYRQPSNTIALYSLGHCYERLGKEAQAVEFYQDCLKFKNYLELPRLRLAAIYFKNGQLEKTIQEYLQHRGEYPDDIETYVLLGHLLMQNGNYDSAVDAFNSAILIHPDNFTSSLEEEKIREIIECGGCDQAIEHINGLLEQQPDSAELHLQLAEVLAEDGNVPQAVEEFEKAVRLQPNFLQAFVKLGSLYMSGGNFPAAAECFNKAAAINDDIVDAYVGLAAAQNKTDEPAEAHNTLMLGAAIQQNSCVLFAEAARLRYCTAAHIKLLDSRESLKIIFETLKQQCSLSPDNQSLLYALGLLFMKKNLFDDAAGCFNQIIQKNPTHYRALSRLALCIAEKGEQAKAIEYLGTDSKISSELLDLHYKTSLLYCSRTDFIDALRTTKERLDENFDSQNALTTLSEVLQNMGLVDRAFACWNLISDMINYAAKG